MAFGTVLFSLVTNEIFSYKHLLTNVEIVKERQKETELLLWKIDEQRTNISLSEEYFSICKTNIIESSLNSTHHYFAENQFYRKLPPHLQAKIVNNVLYNQRATLEYFFIEFDGMNQAPSNFIKQVLINLESGLYRPGDIIIQTNQ